MCRRVPVAGRIADQQGDEVLTRQGGRDRRVAAAVVVRLRGRRERRRCPGDEEFPLPAFPNPVSPAANLAISAASLDETTPLPLVSAANRWFWLTNGTDPAAPCATRAASLELIDAFGPDAFVGLIVYAPAPKPVSVYVPGVPVRTGPTAGDPTVLLSDTFFTNRGPTGLPITLP